MLGQRAESRLTCGIKLILDFLVFEKISIPSCSGRLKECVWIILRVVLWFKVEK